MINETPEWAMKAAEAINGWWLEAASKSLDIKNVPTVTASHIEDTAKFIYIEYLKANLKETEAAHE